MSVSPWVAAVGGNGRTFQVSFLPGAPSPGLGQGEAAAVVLAGAVADVAGNAVARTEFSFKFDFVAPTPTVTMLDGNRTARNPVRRCRVTLKTHVESA